MRMDMNVIKSYLVQLGAKIDDNSWNEATNKMHQLEKTVNDVTSGMAKSFVGASTAIVGALGGVSTATAGLLDHVAQLDLGYQKFALRMYMSTQQAKELKIVTDAMGENINDIAWIPELRQRYMSLMGQTQQLEAQIPGGAEAQLRGIRELRFEFTRLKVEATYALQWIAYYVIKSLSGPLFNIKGGFHELNDWLTQHMPEWTKKVAEVISDIIKWIIGLLPYFKKIREFVQKIPEDFDKLKSYVKSCGDGFTDFALIALAAIGGVSLPVSILSGLVLSIVKNLRGAGDIKLTWQDIADAMRDVMQTFDNFGKSIAISLDKNGAIQSIVEAFNVWKNALRDINKGITDLLRNLGLLGQKQGIGSLLADEFAIAVDMIAKTASSLGHLVSALGKLMSKDVNGALSELKMAAKDFGAAMNEKSPGDRLSPKDTSTGKHRFDEDVESYIASAVNQTGVSANLLRAVIQQESGGNVNALSGAGAIGLMQLMPDTAASIGVNPYDPADNVLGGALYLKQMLDKYGGDMDKALAAYNAGPGAVDKYGGVPPYSETQNYVSQVEGYYDQFVNTAYNPAFAQNARAAMLSNWTLGTGSNPVSSVDQSTTTGNITIYITQPGANEDQIKNAVVAGIRQSNNKSNARMISNFAGVGVSV